MNSSDRLTALRQHYKEGIEMGFPMDHVLSEGDVDFLFEYIDEQEVCIEVLEAAIEDLASEVPDELR